MRKFYISLLIIFFITSGLFAQEYNLTKFYDYFLNSKYNSARVFLEEKLQQEPDDPRLHFYLGKTYLASKEYSSAIREFKKAFQNKKSDAKIYNYMGRIYEEQGMLPEAINVYKTSAKIDSSKTLTQLRLGSLYYKQHNYKDAISTLKNLISNDSTNFHAYYLLARSYLKTAKHDSAILISSKAVALYSSNFPNLLNLGIGYFNTKQFKKAARILEKAVQLSPESDEPRYYLGQTHANLDQRANAVNQLETCANLHGIFKLKALKFLAAYYYQIGLTKECIRTAQKYLTMETDEYLATMYYYMARALSDERKFDEADSAFQKTFKYSDFAFTRSIYFYRGLNFYLQKEYAQAIKFYKKVIILDPYYRFAYYNLAITYDDYYQDKRPAIAYYQKFLTLSSSDKNNTLLIKAAKNRLTDLKKQIFFKK